MAGKEILYKMWISTCTFSWTHHCFSQSTHPQGWHGQYCSGLQATHIMNVCSECSASNHGSANMRDQNTQAWMPMNIAVTVLDVQPKLQYIVPQNPPQQIQHEVSTRHSCNHDWRGTSWQWSQWEVQVDFATIWWSQVNQQAVAHTSHAWGQPSFFLWGPGEPPTSTMPHPTHLIQNLNEGSPHTRRKPSWR